VPGPRQSKAPALEIDDTDDEETAGWDKIVQAAQQIAGAGEVLQDAADVDDIDGLVRERRQVHALVEIDLRESARWQLRSGVVGDVATVVEEGRRQQVPQRGRRATGVQ
jgi:hypothetical protein